MIKNYQNNKSEKNEKLRLEDLNKIICMIEERLNYNNTIEQCEKKKQKEKNDE